MRRWRCRAEMLLGLAIALVGATCGSAQAVESAHVAGPGGMEGWTESVVVETLENQGPLPVRLVISRGGRVVRRIEGSPFVWRWQFVDGGRRVALETGPLHFSMACELVNVRTGRRVGKAYDCWQGVPAGAPGWVRELESGRLRIVR